MPPRRVPPHDVGTVTTSVVALTVAAFAYLVVASGCQDELARHVPDGSCRDRVVYQAARLSDC